jgi:hypothetical protein
MTADDIRDARSSAEDRIMDILNSLQEEIGLCTTAIGIETTQVTTVESRYPRYMVYSVRIHLESL